MTGTSTGSNEMLVRQHERVTCTVAAIVAVDRAQSEQVVLSRAIASGCHREGEFAAMVVDFSPGGLGIRSSVYLPKGCRLFVRLSKPNAPLAGGSTTIEEIAVRVQRCSMIDRTPAYYCGCSLVKAPAGAVALLKSLAASEGANRVEL